MHIVWIPYISDNFQHVGCSCKDKHLMGEFCEKHIPPCNLTTCFENVTCDNNAKNKDNPCGPCPSGYTGSGISCHGKYNLLLDITVN